MHTQKQMLQEYINISRADETYTTFRGLAEYEKAYQNCEKVFGGFGLNSQANHNAIDRVVKSSLFNDQRFKVLKNGKERFWVFSWAFSLN